MEIDTEKITPYSTAVLTALGLEDFECLLAQLPDEYYGLDPDGRQAYWQMVHEAMKMGERDLKKLAALA